MCIRDRLVSETDTVEINNESTNEIAECSDYEMLMCVSELEREWKNNVVVEWGQRANFPFIIYDVYDEDLMLFLKGERPILVDEVKNILMLYKVCLLYTSIIIKIILAKDLTEKICINQEERQDSDIFPTLFLSPVANF